MARFSISRRFTLLALLVSAACSAPGKPHAQTRSTADSISPSSAGPAAAPTSAPPVEAPSAAAAPTAGKDQLFETSVRPILASRCAPCHIPGGKMYARLPFDDPAVVASRVAGISRRLKGDDLRALQAWMATRPPEP